MGLLQVQELRAVNGYLDGRSIRKGPECSKPFQPFCFTSMRRRRVLKKIANGDSSSKSSCGTNIDDLYEGPGVPKASPATSFHLYETPASTSTDRRS